MASTSELTIVSRKGTVIGVLISVQAILMFVFYGFLKSALNDIPLAEYCAPISIVLVIGGVNFVMGKLTIVVSFFGQKRVFVEFLTMVVAVPAMVTCIFLVYYGSSLQMMAIHDETDQQVYNDLGICSVFLGIFCFTANLSVFALTSMSLCCSRGTRAAAFQNSEAHMLATINAQSNYGFHPEENSFREMKGKSSPLLNEA